MSLSFMRLASIRLAAGGVLALAAGCDFPPPPQQSTAAELQALTPAKTCQASLPVFGRFFYPGDVPPGTYIPPQGTIRMNNDGGWCMLHLVSGKTAGAWRGAHRDGGRRVADRLSAATGLYRRRSVRGSSRCSATLGYTGIGVRGARKLTACFCVVAGAQEH